ncbi:glycerophosphodiester phosphodiesterase [Paenibacillus sp. B01]|uniref:glycerophosphodiester phosphodiesterase n=1 Tax=Paenibacillus sp. B01 TaxID=2660554 RepID=UPI00129A37A2|nr:glycerophosphodiester phosphodiesterase [Paenibacillus sp. B01]QGG56406.1 hypothetical protein GE073_13000 [Paenibacillus sp. B01]
MQNYRIIAHTGCEGTPYNSIASCEAGYKAGAEILEVDVRSTKDGVAALYHDDEPDVGAYTYDEWIAAGNGTAVKLEEVLMLFQAREAAFNLDLKTKDAYRAAVPVVNKLNAWHQVYFTGVTDHLAGSEHAKHVVWNLPHLSMEMADDKYEAEVSRYCEEAVKSGFTGINAHYVSCRASLIRQARQHRLMVWIYTLPDDTELIAGYLDMGVDAVSLLNPSVWSKR